MRHPLLLHQRFVHLFLLVLCMMPGIACANVLEEIVVVEITANQGIGIEQSKLPYHVQSATHKDIERAQTLSISDFIEQSFSSVSINHAQNNPLQADVQYRGFTASPLLGLAQGLAVYQDGVRINEPLGDTVNWDLIPESAIYSVQLIGGANPLFGLNSLGGTLSINMKNGFNTEGHTLEVYGGAFERKVVSVESGANNGVLAYYANLHYFDENGWRDESESDAVNLYANLSWRSQLAELNVNFHHGSSELIGNGAIPIELLATDRDAIFTAPDITENGLFMFSSDLKYSDNDKTVFSGNAFYRHNDTDAFNGDGSEFVRCVLGGSDRLLDGLEEDELEALGLDEEDVCADQIVDRNTDGSVDGDDLEDFLNTLVVAGTDGFEIEDLTTALSGNGTIDDDAINNISDRAQQSYGSDVQLGLLNELFEFNNHFVLGFTYFKGKSTFNSRTELAGLDERTRSTADLGTGTFVDSEATRIQTRTETASVYFSDTLDLTERLSFTFSGRFNNTQITLADQSGERPELNGEHDYFRFNPAFGISYKTKNNINVYLGYSESSRVPTPIELACNDRVFDLAILHATLNGEDPDDVELECRLPNAFLADPPLEQVVAKNLEIGARGQFGDVHYYFGLFRTVNKDDIIFQTTGRSTGLFSNVNETRRQGLETALNARWKEFSWYMKYSYIHATFEDGFASISPNHPFADNDGRINVGSGADIPGIPRNQLKLGGDYFLTEKFSLGLDLLYYSSQFMRGDESNQLEQLKGYFLLKLRGRYIINEHLQIFAKIDNLTDSDYESFGLLGEEPNELPVDQFQNFNNPRFVSPGAPRAGFIGIKLSI